MKKNIVTNPFLNLDYPDPDIIRVGDTYYMTTTTMHFMPSIPILKSKDLNHWEIASYVTDSYENHAAQRLENGRSAYGKGVWATTLRYHKGTFYLMFNCNEEGNTYVYRTKDIENGPWEKSILQGSHHDLSLLFDEDRAFIVYGNGTIWITELTEDLRGRKPGGVHQILLRLPYLDGMNCEGSHFYKINGMYYLLMIDWPKGGMRREWCYRSFSLLGKYEGKLLVNHSMGYYKNGVAQGGIFDTPNGDWYAVLFQDRFAAGRFPVLVPVTWKDGWPLMGKNGTGEVEEQLEVKLPLDENFTDEKKVSDETTLRDAGELCQSDEFTYEENRLAFCWQWNHNPDNTAWSVTERKGWLRLKNRNPATDLERARNTLTQRAPSPWCLWEVKLDTSGMKPGDFAGITAWQSNYGYVGARLDAKGKRQLVFGIRDKWYGINEQTIPLKQSVIYLRIEFDFRNGPNKPRDLAYFYYSLDGEHWIQGKAALQMKYTLDHFAGYRIGLFSYNKKLSSGYADFDYARVLTEIIEKEKSYT